MSRLYKCQADSYEIINDPGTLVISVADMKEHLKIPASVTADDNYIEALIKASTLFVEDMIRRSLITKTYKTYRDFFPSCNYIYGYYNYSDNNAIILKRSKFQSLESFKYYVDDVLTAVDSDIYYTTSETNYSGIFLKETQSWPTDGDERRQMIEIEFKAGYGTASTDIPYDIIEAIKLIVAKLYANRGDCGNIDSIKNCVTAEANAMLYKYKIEKVSLCQSA